MHQVTHQGPDDRDWGVVREVHQNCNLPSTQCYFKKVFLVSYNTLTLGADDERPMEEPICSQEMKIRLACENRKTNNQPHPCCNGGFVQHGRLVQQFGMFEQSARAATESRS